VRLCADAHRRGRQREAGLRARTFSVERHIRSKWACKQCETVVQAPVAPHIIDKGIPTTNLLAQVLISKYADHLPLYRQEQIYARAGVELRDRRWRTGWDAAASS
jgi:transposase